MLGPSLPLLLLLLGSRGQAGTKEKAVSPAGTREKATSPASSRNLDIACSASSLMAPVLRPAKAPIRLQPLNYTAVEYVTWHVKLAGESQWWRLTQKYSGVINDQRVRSHFTDRLTFSEQDWALLLQPALPQDSGRYCLEVTYDSGVTNMSAVNVTVWEQLEKPQVGAHVMTRNETWCRLLLNCSVPGGNTVTLMWSRNDTQLYQVPASLPHLQQEVEAHSAHTYTCNASDAHSWAHSTLSLSPGCCVGACADAPGSQFDPAWLWLLGVPLIIVLLITSVFLRRRGRNVPSGAKEESGEQSLPQPSCAQDENSPAGEGNTIYSLVQTRNRNRNQSKCSASTPPDSESMTLYSMVQPSQPQEGAPRPPPSCTVYQEVGRRLPQPQKPARLSHKELRNFEIYC